MRDGKSRDIGWFVIVIKLSPNQGRVVILTYDGLHSRSYMDGGITDWNNPGRNLTVQSHVTARMIRMDRGYSGRAGQQMAGVSRIVAMDRVLIDRHCVSMRGGSCRGYGWPATIELLSQPSPANSTTQAVRDFYGYYHGKNESMITDQYHLVAWTPLLFPQPQSDSVKGPGTIDRRPRIPP